MLEPLFPVLLRSCLCPQDSYRLSRYLHALQALEASSSDDASKDDERMNSIWELMDLDKKTSQDIKVEWASVIPHKPSRNPFGAFLGLVIEKPRLGKDKLKTKKGSY